MPAKKKIGARRPASLAARLRAFGLRYPGAHLKSPWPGHLDLAVKDKTFAYLSLDDEPFAISCKLPMSGGIALSLRGARPTPYGLGKSGWVSLSEEEGADVPPAAVLEEWIDESYRAQAPKKLIAELDAHGAGQRGVPPRSTRTRSTGKSDACTSLRRRK